MKLAMGLEASKVITFTLNITPAALTAAIKAQEQTFTVPAGAFQSGESLQLTDAVYVTPPTQNNSLAPFGYAFVSTVGPSGTAVITFGFYNLTAAASTPPAGNYLVTIVRP